MASPPSSSRSRAHDVTRPAPLRAPSLEGIPGVTHAFSRLLRTPEDHAIFAQDGGFGSLPLLRLRQVHGSSVVRVDAPPAAASSTATPAPPPEGDAFVTDRPGLVIAAASADCVPVLIVDPERRVAAAVHAGWRGMSARVIARALDTLGELGARPERLRAAVGPCIQGSCYEVGDEVRAAFEKSFPEASSLFHGRRLDLVAAARAELERGGIEGARFSALALCTHCRPDLASYRREGTGRGTNLAAIALV